MVVAPDELDLVAGEDHAPLFDRGVTDSVIPATLYPDSRVRTLWSKGKITKSIQTLLRYTPELSRETSACVYQCHRRASGNSLTMVR